MAAICIVPDNKRRTYNCYAKTHKYKGQQMNETVSEASLEYF